MRAAPATRRRLPALGLLLAVLGLVPGCGSLGVRAWERDQLARPEMRMDPNPTESGIDDHIYFSKEAASGGRGFGGGGCGCN